MNTFPFPVSIIFLAGKLNIDYYIIPNAYFGGKFKYWLLYQSKHLFWRENLNIDYFYSNAYILEKNLNIDYYIILFFVGKLNIDYYIILFLVGNLNIDCYIILNTYFWREKWKKFEYISLFNWNYIFGGKFEYISISGPIFPPKSEIWTKYYYLNFPPENKIKIWNSRHNRY